ncbi:nucleotidyl transferase AbiEii/AbiGii toxin family protein [Elusimicrobiota bacterium]
MISESQIREFVVKFQTTELNISREYIQNMILSSLYGEPQVGLAFKGGTALRILKRSPRFSEDLDFTGWGKPFHIGEAIGSIARKCRDEGISLKLKESYKTAGGWFARLATELYSWPIEIEMNVSLRAKGPVQTEMVLASSVIYPSYLVKSLAQDVMIAEKVQAALTRKKPRDFFDVYFILRERLSIRKIIPFKARLISQVKTLNSKELDRELKIFLPKSYWPVVKKLPTVLKQELERL